MTRPWRRWPAAVAVALAVALGVVVVGAEPAAAEAAPRRAPTGFCDTLGDLVGGISSIFGGGGGGGDDHGIAGEACDRIGDGVGAVGDFLKDASCFVDALPRPVQAAAFGSVFTIAAPLGLMDMPWCDTELPDARPTCAELAAAGHEDESGRPNLGGLLPDRCWGTYPSSYYDFNYDGGGVLDFRRQVLGTLTGLAFSAGKGLTQVGLWLTGWSYEWDAEDRLGLVSNDLADRFDRGLVGPFQLDFVAWFVVVTWAGFTMLRGRISVAGGELVLSVLLAAVAAVFVANLAGYRAGAFHTLTRLSDAVLSVGDSGELPDTPRATDEVLGDHLRSLHIAFVEEPYDHLNWGRSLGGYADDAGATAPIGLDCVPERDAIVARGPHGADGFPRQVMVDGGGVDDVDGGCVEEAAFNGEASWDKFFATILYLVAALFMFLLLGMVALTIVLAKLGVIFLFALAPFATVLAVLPGGGRRSAWRWLSSLLSMLGLVAAMSFVLAFLVVAVDGFLTSTNEAVEPIERFLVLDALVAGAVIARKRLLAAGMAMANQLGDRLAISTPAGSGSVGASGGGAGGGGSNLPELAATYMAYHSVDRLFERRRRRVDSTRANRRHGIWMLNNNLTPFPGGGGGGGGGGGAAGGGRLNRVASFLQPRYGGATVGSRIANRARARARNDLSRARTLGRGAQRARGGVGSLVGGGRRAGANLRGRWTRGGGNRREILQALRMQRRGPS